MHAIATGIRVRRNGHGEKADLLRCIKVAFLSGKRIIRRPVEKVVV